MALNNVNLVISISLLAIIVDITALKCVKETACSCHLANGDFYDLKKLSTQDFLNVSSEYGYQFSFQPCKNVKMNLGPKNATSNMTECNNSTGVSLCALHNGENSFSLGNTMETKWDLLETSTELELNHASKITRIKLSCCPTCKSSLLNLDEKPEPTKFHFVLTSQYACKIHGESEGISTGSVLVILLFVFSATYLLVGALVLRLFRGAIGWEMVPNYDFWSDLPALVRDGVVFTFSGCSTNTYDRI